MLFAPENRCHVVFYLAPLPDFYCLLALIALIRFYVSWANYFCYSMILVDWHSKFFFLRNVLADWLFGLLQEDLNVLFLSVSLNVSFRFFLSLFLSLSLSLSRLVSVLGSFTPVTFIFPSGTILMESSTTWPIEWTHNFRRKIGTLIVALL